MRNRLIPIFVGVFCLSLSLTWDRDPQMNLENSDLGSIDLLSKSMDIERQTELPKATETQAKAKDSNIVKELMQMDPGLKKKWDIKLTSTLKAWRAHGVYGNRDIKVCVIDTGIDVNHPKIKDSLAVNKGEGCKGKDGKYVFCHKSTNGIDDDGNGFVDDVYGYDFALNSGKLDDKHGHGTHIAGLIAGKDGFGVAPGVSLIIAKYFDPKAAANNNLLNTIRSIRYCAARGADIINYSGGGLEPSKLEKEAIASALDKNGRPILFIAAAGNERNNADFKKYYPADYDLPNIISVTAHDENKNVLSSSNYGSQTVDIVAPGRQLLSLMPDGKFGRMTGTSQATAVVTGAAAMMKQKFPDYSTSEIIAGLTETGDYNPQKFKGKTNREKSLNIYRALALVGQGTSVSGVKPTNAHNLKPESFTAGTEERRAATGLGIDPAAMAELLERAKQDLQPREQRLGGN